VIQTTIHATHYCKILQEMETRQPRRYSNM
jgi:hypothetical protein